MIQRAYVQIWSQLSDDASFRDLSAHAQGKIYAAHIRHFPRQVQYWLHLARRGELTFKVFKATGVDSNQLHVWVMLLSEQDPATE